MLYPVCQGINSTQRILAWRSENMAEQITTIKVTKPVVKILTGVKGMLEYATGDRLDLNTVITMAVIDYDWKLARLSGMTKKTKDEYVRERLNQVLGPDQGREIYSILEAMGAFGLRR